MALTGPEMDIIISCRIVRDRGSAGTDDDIIGKPQAFTTVALTRAAETALMIVYPFTVEISPCDS